MEFDLSGKKGIFDQLKEANNGVALSDKEKDELLKKIEIQQNEEGKYIDAFNNPISFNGIMGLVKGGTKLSLSPIHKNEMIVCASDYKYFRKNYCKIVTKKGINRPDPRNYQEKAEDDLISGGDILIFWSRQSGKSVTISTYLLWQALFKENINIGIAANIQKLAVEILDKIKKMYVELPVWIQPGINVWNKQSIELWNGVKILTSATNGDSFRGYSVHCLYIDECAFIRPSLYEEFSDSVFPAQEALQEKQTILSSTANGLNHWYSLVEGARKGKNGYVLNECSWRDVPRWNKDGTIKDPDEFKKEQIAKNGVLYWNQNFENKFLGSSYTLISAETLKNIEPIDEEEVIFDTIFEGLRIFKEPQIGRQYIITCDPKKEGLDAAALQVIDVTKIPFEEVAAADIHESYLTLPGRLFDLGNYYNSAMVICENNIAESVPSTLFYHYDYEGEVFTEKDSKGKPKKEMGVRTTIKSKRLGLTMMKKFIEENSLIINDKKTQHQMFTFLEKSNGTFSAEEGYKDDLVMALMLLFFPFFEFKNWDDFRGFIDYMEKRKEQEQKQEQEAADFLDLGINDGTEENDSPFTDDLWENREF